MVPVQHGPLNRGRLHQSLGDLSWTEVGTASFGTKLSLDINTW